jgi:hypothetical protein
MLRLQWRSLTQHCKSAVTSGEVVASRVDSHSTRLVLVGQLLGVRREEVELNTLDGEDTSFSPDDSESSPSPACLLPPPPPRCRAKWRRGARKGVEDKRNKPWSGRVLLCLALTPCRCSDELLPCFFPSLCHGCKSILFQLIEALLFLKC